MFGGMHVHRVADSTYSMFAHERPVPRETSSRSAACRSHEKRLQLIHRGPVVPERILKSGAPVRRKAPKFFFFFDRAPLLFGSKSTISRFGERFRDGQYSLVSFLFAVFYSRCPPRPVPSHL